VLYVASSNPFNTHGLQLFLRQAWTTVLRRVPEATLRIAGSIPVAADTDTEHIVHVGRLSDEELRNEYQLAHAVINPQIAGTGLKIKCVEALSAGCPLVVNRAGADGMESGAGTAFLLAEDWNDFAAHVVAILTDDARRQQLEVQARQFAEKLFPVDATFAELAQLLATRLPSS
jgi:glycosyltransferase involved in cell wall biosynthesis